MVLMSMKLGYIWLSTQYENKLDNILEHYNQEHPDDILSYQQMAEKLLKEAIYSKDYALKHKA